MKSLKNQQGFTLIEILIAITIMAFLMAAVYTIVSNSADTKDRVVNEDRAFVQVIRSLDRFQTDVQQIWSPLYSHAAYNETVERERAQATQSTFKPPRFQKSDNFQRISVNLLPVPTFHADEKTDISFFTAANRRKLQDSKQSRYTWVRYSLRRMETPEKDDPKFTGLFELIRQYQNQNLFIDRLDPDEFETQVLLRNVKSLEFSFWDKRSEKFVDRLQDTDDPNVVRAISVKIVWIDPDGNEQEFSRVARPLWPKFDTKKDEEEKEIFRKSGGGGNRGGGGGSGDAPPPDDDGEPGDDQ